MQKIETITPDKKLPRKSANTETTEAAKAALLRLAEKRRKLQPVDAVAIVREGRDSANRAG